MAWGRDDILTPEATGPLSPSDKCEANFFMFDVSSSARDATGPLLRPRVSGTVAGGTGPEYRTRGTRRLGGEIPRISRASPTILDSIMSILKNINDDLIIFSFI